MPSAYYKAIIRALDWVTSSSWRLLTSAIVAWVLLLVLCAFSLAGGVIPQAAANPYPVLSQEEVLATLRAPSLTATVFGSPGLSHLYHTRAFRALLTAMAVVASARLLSLWIPVWTAEPSPPTTTLTFACAEGEQMWPDLARVVQTTGHTLVRLPQRDGLGQALVIRRGWRRWLPSFVYLGLLVLLMAALVGERWGWTGPYLELALGESRPLAPKQGDAASPPLVVRLEQIVIYPHRDGDKTALPARLESLIALLQSGEVVQLLPLGPNAHGVYDGLSYYQVDYGPAARVSAQRADGRALLLQYVAGSPEVPRLGPAQPAGVGQVLARVRFAPQQQEQLIAIPEVGALVRLLYYPRLPAQGIAARTLHLQISRGSDGVILAERFLQEDGLVTVTNGSGALQGIEVSVAFEYYVLLHVQREPELPLAAAGGALMAVGLLASVLWPPRQAWVCVGTEDEGLRCSLVTSNRDRFAQWFCRLADALRDRT